MSETVIVIAIIAAAAFFVVRRAMKSTKSASCGCSGCSCDAAGTTGSGCPTGSGCLGDLRPQQGGKPSGK